MLQSIAIVVLSMLAAVTYGVLHDQVTVRVCLEYFTIGHPPVFREPFHSTSASSPTFLAMVWGVIATWWVGLGLGILLAIAARGGNRPPRDVGSLVRPILLLMVITGLLAAIAGLVGYTAANWGLVRMTEPMASLVPPDKHTAFIADLWTHSASYLFGAVGGVVLMVRTWQARTTVSPNRPPI